MIEMKSVVTGEWSAEDVEVPERTEFHEVVRWRRISEGVVFCKGHVETLLDKFARAHKVEMESGDVLNIGEC
jgi:nitric oxide reductase large subunit